MSNASQNARAGVVGKLELVESALQYLEGNVPAMIPLKYGNYTIGRGSTCDIQIKAQLDGKFIISRAHAMLKIGAEGCSIQDTGSTNGVYVNDQRINSAQLHNGDIIRFAGMSEVPVGSFLKTSNVSVMYMVRLFAEEEAEKKRALLHASSAVKKSVAGSNQVTSNGNMSSESGSKRTKKEKYEDAQITKRMKHTPDQEHALLPPSSPYRVNSVAVLNELKELKSMHSKELAEMREKFESLHKAIAGGGGPKDAGERKEHTFLPPTPIPIPAKAPASLPTSVISVCEQDSKSRNGVKMSSLKSSLSCALCRDILALPVVLPCSHGYCALCIEKSMRKKKHLCPVCCDPPYEGQQRIYYRSEHIENIVWILLGASDSAEHEMKRYEDRLASAEKELKQLGVDLHAPYKHAEGHVASASSQVSAVSVPPVTCDYCGSTANDHTESNCPHKLHGELDEGSSEEDL
eukprot:gene31517-38094_t